MYTLNYTGCRSCFAYKRKSNSYGSCVVKDDLYDLLQELADADGILFASPLYFGEITGQMKLFLERLLFPYHTYETEFRSIAPKKMPVYMLYTMNVTQEQMDELGYRNVLAGMEGLCRTCVYSA